MSTPSIRALGAADAPALPALRLQGLTECPEAFGSSREEFEARGPEGREQWAHDRLAVEEGGIWGAFLGDRLVGMVGLQREAGLKMRHKAMIWGMYVAPEGRGQGLGRKLMEAAIAHARTLPGVDRINLTVVPTQAAAFGLYRALGFVEWGREPGGLRVAGRDVDEAHMALRLG